METVSTFSLVGMVVTLAVTMLLPVILLLVWGIKFKKEKFFSAWFLGAVGFVVPQVFIRIPLLQILQKVFPGITSFAKEHMLTYFAILAATAALFELVGRYAAVLPLRKQLTCRRAFAAGVGHGSIEAIVLIGLTYINNLIFSVMINNGSFDSLTSTLPEQAKAPMEVAKNQLLTTPGAYFFLAGYERILTVILHIALTMTLYYFIKKQKGLLGAITVFIAHFLVDFSAGVLQVNMQNPTSGLGRETLLLIMYAFLTVVAILSMLQIFRLKKIWPKETSLSTSTAGMNDGHGGNTPSAGDNDTSTAAKAYSDNGGYIHK